MEIQINEAKRGETGHFYFSGTCGKTSATVVVHTDGNCRVICQNAAHKVWKGFGRLFADVGKATEAYKSAEMRALIFAANSSASLTA